MPIELRRLFLGRHTPRSGGPTVDGSPSPLEGGRSASGSGVEVGETRSREPQEGEQRALRPVTSRLSGGSGTVVQGRAELVDRGVESQEQPRREGAENPAGAGGTADATAEQGGRTRETEEIPSMTKWELQLTLISLSVSGFLSALDTSIIVTAMPTIASQFSSLSQQQWIALSYLLTSTVFQPLLGRATDLFGSRSVLFLSIFLFELGSLLCALARNFVWLCCARAIAGMGSGGLGVVIMVVVSQIVPLRERGKYMGIMYARLVVSTVFGPLIGGGLAQYDWRWCFYINLIIAGPTVGILLAFARKLPHRTKPDVSWRDVDFGGIALVATFTICLALGFNWGGVVYPWNSPLIIALLVVGFVGVPAFVFWEIKVAPFPLIPMGMFKYRNVTAGVANNFFSSVSLQGLFLYLPSYYQIVRHDPQIISGLDILPYAIPVLFVSTVSGWWISKTGNVRRWLWLGGVINIAGSGLLTLMNGRNPRAVEYVLLVFSGIGAGFLTQTITLSAQSEIGRDLIATVTTMTLWSRRLGNILSAAMQGSIISNFFKQGILADPNAAPYVNQLLAADNVTSLPPDVQLVAAQSYGAAFRMMMIATTVFCVPGFLWSLSAKKQKMS